MTVINHEGDFFLAAVLPLEYTIWEDKVCGSDFFFFKLFYRKWWQKDLEWYLLHNRFSLTSANIVLIFIIKEEIKYEWCHPRGVRINSLFPRL